MTDNSKNGILKRIPFYIESGSCTKTPLVYANCTKTLIVYGKHHEKYSLAGIITIGNGLLSFKITNIHGRAEPFPAIMKKSPVHNLIFCAIAVHNLDYCAVAVHNRNYCASFEYICDSGIMTSGIFRQIPR